MEKSGSSIVIINSVKKSYTSDFLGGIAIFFLFGLSSLVNALEYCGFNIFPLRQSKIISIILILILVVILLRKKIKLQRNMLILCIMYFFALSLSYIITPAISVYILPMVYVFVSSVVPIFIVFNYIGSSASILRHLRNTSYIVLLSSGVVPFTKAYLLETDYMDFAYTSLLSWAVITYFAIKERKIIDVVFSVTLALIYIVYSTRGAIVCIVVFFAYSLFRLQRGKKKKETIVKAITLLSLIVLFSQNLFKGIANLALKWNLSTYTIKHFLGSGMFTADSRMSLYGLMIDMIGKNPFGYGIGYDRIIGGGNGKYAHNIFLEFLVDYGVVLGGMLILYLIMVFSIMLLKCDDEDYKALFSVFSIVGLTILFFSSSVYLRYDIFASFLIYFMYKESKKKRMMKEIFLNVTVLP